MNETQMIAPQGILELNYIGTDHWDRPVYIDQHENLWKDIELGDGETPSLYYAGKDFDGEPEYLIRKTFIIKKPFVQNTKRFEYGMLGRLQSDCDTHLDDECARSLSENEIKYTIEEMKNLWNQFEDYEKPQWITWEQILSYEERMIST